MTAYILTAEAESDLRSVIRYTRAQWGGAQVRRYVFCLPREHAPALIVAILHERMDLMKRLVDRLNE